SLDTSALRFHNGAEVTDFNPEQHFPATQSELMDRFAQFAVVAAREAVSTAKLQSTPDNSARTAVIVGSCVGGQSSQDSGFQELYGKNRNRVHPLTIPRVMMNAGASHICMDLGITGPA